MSKLNLRLSYKNACILKHALRDKVEAKENIINSVDEKTKTELKEEKRALAAITEEINLEMNRHS
jgi:hypothetical protein